MVLLVVQGGPGTLQTMVAAAKQGTALLVLGDSGGAATACRAFFKEGAVPEDDEKLKGFRSEKALGQLRELKAADDRWHKKLVAFFSLQDENTDMSSHLLHSIVERLKAEASTQASWDAAEASVNGSEGPAAAVRTTEFGTPRGEDGLVRH